ncbi:hypothetical protein SH449x_000298 [Pirellulaceae bacterium SH449]
MRPSFMLVFLVCVTTFLGCGGVNEGGPPSKDPLEKQGLNDIASMLKQLEESGEKVPSTAAEMANYEAFYPYAGPMLRDKKIEYFLGAKFDSSNPPKQVARETKAPDSGGWVLLSNGEIRELSPGELAGFPVGGKSTASK